MRIEKVRYRTQKNRQFDWKLWKFREINSLVTSLVKTLIWRKKCQISRKNRDRVLWYFYTLYCISSFVNTLISRNFRQKSVRVFRSFHNHGKFSGIESLKLCAYFFYSVEKRQSNFTWKYFVKAIYHKVFLTWIKWFHGNIAIFNISHQNHVKVWIAMRLDLRIQIVMPFYRILSNLSR